MKIFQELRTAIDEWESSRDTILKIANKLNCSETEIMGKIEQLQNARPANDLNAINERLDELMEGLDDAMSRAERVDSQVNNAYNEIEYCDAGEVISSIEDVSVEFSDFRKDIRKQLDESKG